MVFGLEVALVAKNLPANAGDKKCGFDPWVGKIPWMRAWKPTPVFLSEKSHGQRSLADYSSQDRRVRHDSHEDFTHTCCLVAKSCWILDLMDCCPAGLSLCPWDFPGRNTGIVCHFPPPGDFSNPGVKIAPSVWQVNFFTTETCGKPRYMNMHN